MRKYSSVILVLLLIVMNSCSKNTEKKVESVIPTGTVLASGSFTSNTHPTSGTVKVIRDASGRKHLVFENFRSDNGPDLDVWLSPDITGSPYQSLGDLKALNGSFSYELNSGIDYTANSRVLIWCVDFSVLFGHAILQ